MARSIIIRWEIIHFCSHLAIGMSNSGRIYQKIVSVSHFHIYLPWGLCLWKCFQPGEWSIKGLLRVYEPSNGPMFQALCNTPHGCGVLLLIGALTTLNIDILHSLHSVVTGESFLLPIITLRCVLWCVIFAWRECTCVKVIKMTVWQNDFVSRWLHDRCLCDKVTVWQVNPVTRH